MYVNPNWLEGAAISIMEDKKTHIPYLIFDRETIIADKTTIAQEILSHTQTKKIIEELSSNNPSSIDTSTIITSNLEIRPSNIQQDVRQIMDRQMIGGYFVDLNPESSSTKVRLYRRSEVNQKPHLEVVTKSECTSPDKGIISKTEFYNINEEKISDQYHLQFSKDAIDRDEATEQLSSDFYLNIISETESTVSHRSHPKGITIEIGFTSDINGEMPMIVFISTDDNLLEKTNPSSSVRNQPELMKKYQEIATSYASQILGKQISLQIPS